MAAVTAPAACRHDTIGRRAKEFYCKVCGARVQIRKASKHHNEKITTDNIEFDSRREERRYRQLKLLARAGRIRKLELQPRFDFKIDGVLMFSYYADFKYLEVLKQGTDREVVEDAKGQRLPVYRLKQKIIEAHHKIRIVEI